VHLSHLLNWQRQKAHLSNGFEKFPKFSRKDRRKASSLFIGLLVFYRLVSAITSIFITSGFSGKKPVIKQPGVETFQCSLLESFALFFTVDEARNQLEVQLKVLIEREWSRTLDSVTELLEPAA
jgi:hypothetical protein